MRADARRNYERILEVAHEVFAESGTEASLEEIARRAEVGTGTLYRHFPTREDLFVGVMKSVFEDQHLEARRQLENPDPVDAFESYIRYWFRHTARYKGIAAELMTEAMRSERGWVTTCEITWADSDILLARAQSAGQLRTDITAKEVWRLLHGIAMTVGNGSLSNEEGERMLDVVIRGLRPDFT